MSFTEGCHIRLARVTPGAQKSTGTGCQLCDFQHSGRGVVSGDYQDIRFLFQYSRNYCIDLFYLFDFCLRSPHLPRGCPCTCNEQKRNQTSPNASSRQIIDRPGSRDRGSQSFPRDSQVPCTLDRPPALLPLSLKTSSKRGVPAHDRPRHVTILAGCSFLMRSLTFSTH